jgi:apolipoprotein D and lipocalin family protein
MIEVPGMRFHKFQAGRLSCAARAARAVALGALAACCFAVTAQAAFTPPAAPTKPVDLQRYAGRWYEIARVPNHFERGKNCEGSTADYTQDAKGAVTVVQTCHDNSPTGPERVYHATARILDPGMNAKLKLTFYLFLSKDYWVLDHAPDYKWAIVGDPTGKFLWLFSRQPVITPALKDALLARSKALGYDTSRLEFPIQG